MAVWSSRLNGGSVVADPGTPDIYNQRLNASTGSIEALPYADFIYVVTDYILEDTVPMFTSVFVERPYAATDSFVDDYVVEDGIYTPNRGYRSPNTRVDNVTPSPRILPG